MYRIDEFERIIRSNLSDEEVAEKIMGILSQDKIEFFYDKNNLGYHAGFINENTYIPITNGYICDAVLKVDETTVYLQAVRDIRDKLNNNTDYKIAAIFTIKNLIHQYFYEDKSNTESIELFNRILETRKNFIKTRKGGTEKYYSQIINWSRNKFIFETGSEEDYNVIYNLTTSKGLGDGAQCVERNTLSNNLLNFFGFPSINISSKIIINGQTEYHNFNIYQLLPKQNFIIFDAAQEIYILELPKDCNIETGFSLHIDKPRNIEYIFESSKSKTRKKLNN